MNIPNAPLKGIFFIHFLLSTWAMQLNWLPCSYMYYNMVFILMLLWCLHEKESEEPVFMALIIDLTSIVLDIIVISLCYPSSDNMGSRFHFSSGMCILNLLLRPVSFLVLIRIYRERGGRYSDFGGVPGISTGRGMYDDIDQRNPQSVPKTPIDTGSPSHGYVPPEPPTSHPYSQH